MYRFSGDFNKQLLPKVATITDQIPMKEAERIGFIFLAVKLYIAKSFPQIFKPQKEEQEEEITMPVFRNKEKHTPFSQIIVMMAADELRLLGNLNECKKTPLYDFLTAFVESKRIHKMKTAIGG